MKPYDPKTIEPKWQKIWEKTGLYKTVDDPKRPNEYVLTMFPYPSGDLHTGHWYAYSGPDIVARQRRMAGKGVLHPIGFDAFGLNAENAAIKRNIPPAKWTRQNIANMTRQLHELGAMYDWDRVIDTSKPDYYKWTQWLFLKLHQMGLAYREKGWQNWCPKDQTVLANEQVVGENNVCERCGTPVIKKELEQWFFKITDYAERLLDDLKELDWPKPVKVMQQNWIGRSEGVNIDFPLEGNSEVMTVFTKFPETIFGVTFMIVAPEHPLVPQLTTADQKQAVEAYIMETSGKTNLDRLEDEKTKTGVFSGGYVINPATQAKVPVWIADYVLMGYGTGAVMGVPGHDERDFEFAQKYYLPIVRVIGKSAGDTSAITKIEDVIEDGVLVNSDELDGLKAHSPANAKTMDWLEQKKFGQRVTNYRLRDWLISRQRYWGAPIPIVYCDKCGIVPVPEEDLPVLLPEEVAFKPTGKSPLLEIADFVNTECPSCGGPAKRETDTMDTFVDSSWYYLRFPNPGYSKGPFDPQEVKKWLPVKHYLGGIEHAILHLLYSRFITKALYDGKLVDFKEPFLKLSNQGIILGPDGQKMSKSRGNVVNPDEQVAAYGADTFRSYLMFTGPWQDGGPFDTKGIAGLRRFLERVWVLVREFLREKNNPSGSVDNQAELEARLSILVQKAAKQVTADISQTSFNTAIASLMELTNSLYKLKVELLFGAATKVWQQNLEDLLKLLAPFAPHITEELWAELGSEASIHVQAWPGWDDALIKEELVTIVVQINGKVRANVTVAAGSDQNTVVAEAQKNSNVTDYLKSKTIKKTIFVADRLVNFVVS